MRRVTLNSAMFTRKGLPTASSGASVCPTTTVVSRSCQNFQVTTLPTPLQKNIPDHLSMHLERFR